MGRLVRSAQVGSRAMASRYSSPVRHIVRARSIVLFRRKKYESILALRCARVYHVGGWVGVVGLSRFWPNHQTLPTPHQQ